VQPNSRPSQDQIKDAVTTTLAGWGREFDLYQKFWWVDWREMTGDVVEATRTGEAVVDDDEPEPSHRRVDDDPSPVGDILALLDEVLNPNRAASGYSRRTGRSAASDRSTSSLLANSSARAAPPSWSSSAQGCDRLGARFFQRIF
jgi:hypothetical protein